MTTDDYGDETKWYLYNSTGETIASGGPYANNHSYTKDFNLATDCYIFNMEDSFGDGGGAYSLKDSHGILIHESDGGFGSGEEVPFHTEVIAGIEAIKTNLPVNIYPNPVCETLTVDFDLSFL